MRYSIKAAALVLALAAVPALGAQEAGLASPESRRDRVYLDAGNLAMGAILSDIQARLGMERILPGPAPLGGALSLGAEAGLYLDAPRSADGALLQVDLEAIARWRARSASKGAFVGLGLGALYFASSGEDASRFGALALAELGWDFSLFKGRVSLEPLARGYLAATGPAAGGGVELLPSFGAGLRLSYRFGKE